MQYVKYIVAFVVIALTIFWGLYALDAFTPEAFSILAASVIAIAFERFPWLKKDFDLLPPEGKQLVMWVLLAVLVFGAFGLSCGGIIPGFACTWDGALQALLVLALAIAGNQGVYKLVRKY